MGESQVQPQEGPVIHLHRMDSGGQSEMVLCL